MTHSTEKDALRDLSNRATPGPWRQEFYRDGEVLPDGTGGMDDHETPGSTVYVIDATSPEGYCLTEFDAGSPNDAAFIVAAVNYVRTHVIPPAETDDERASRLMADRPRRPDDFAAEPRRPRVTPPEVGDQ